MRVTRFHPAPLALAAAIAAASATVTPLALAQPAPPAPVAFAIPAQPLSQALNELARQASLQMSFPAALVAGKTAPAVQGTLSARAALDRLLAGSGLVATVDGNAVVVRQAATGATLAPVEVRASADTAGALPEAHAGGQAARGGRMGLLGNRDIMDTPFSTTQYTAQLIEDQQAQNIGDILVNDPSVRNTYARGAGRDEFNIRGFTLFNYDVSFNGLYGLSPRNASSLIGIERVEVLRGPNALLNGMAPAGSVGGAVNLVPKRAGAAPLNRVTLSYLGDSQFGTHVDVGRRFGDQQQVGARVNAAYRKGDMPEDHAREKLDAITLGLDYQGDRLRLEADLGHQDRLTHARSSLLFPPGLGTQIGPAPDAKTNFREDWTYWKTRETSAMVRADYTLTSDWKAFAAAGAQQYDFSSLQTSSLLLDTAGNIMSRPARLDEYVDTRTAEAGVRGKFRTGSLRHELVASTRTYRLELGSLRATGALISSNIYRPTPNPRPTIVLAGPIPKVSETRLDSVALADTISSADGRVQLTLGLRHQSVETAPYDESAVTPTVALLFRATDALSFYGNYIEGLSQGPTAPATASNPGEVFPPGKSRQVEAGVKFDSGGFITTLSVFQIERPSSYLEPVTLRFGMDGRQRNRGVELFTQGEAMRGVRVLAGAAYTDGTLVKTDGGTNDGRTAPATPKLQLNAAAEWDTASVPGLTLTARGVRTSTQYVDPENTQKLPGWTRLDIGARYKFTSGKVPVTLRATVENVLGKNYWLSAAREGLTVGAPRTLLVSATADF